VVQVVVRDRAPERSLFDTGERGAEGPGRQMGRMGAVDPSAFPAGARTVSADRLTRRVGSLATSPSLRLAVRRLLIAVPVLWGVSALTFVVMSVLPGNAAQQLLGAQATPAQVHALELQLGLDKPAWVRYADWLGGVVTGNLGKSIASSEPVTTIIGERLPVTLELVVYALLVSVALAVPVALLAARRPGGLADRVSMGISMAGVSMANYVLALVLVIVLAVYLPIFPAIGFVPLAENVGANLRSLTLPALAIGLPLAGFYTRLLRADIADQMQEDYVVTARAKGVGPWQVLVRHALRNSLFGLLTIVGVNLGTLIGATVIIEQIFSLPGIGQAFIQAINNRDVPLIEAIVLVLAAAVVLANLLTDVLYAVLDPRIRYGQRPD
jgi:peptide/nickel transport system permease protein